MKPDRRAARIVLACVLICIATFAYAQQDYPVKPITLLIPFPPGTGNDVVGRTVGNKLSEYLGQRVVADNRAGASGNIAIEAARRAAPDGYTLVVASTSFSINLYTIKVSFGLSDFTPVALIGKLPYTLMVAKSLPARNMKELVELLKTKPGQLNAGSGGATGTGFFLLETLKKTAGVDVQLVPYQRHDGRRCRSVGRTYAHDVRAHGYELAAVSRRKGAGARRDRLETLCAHA